MYKIRKTWQFIWKNSATSVHRLDVVLHLSSIHLFCRWAAIPDKFYGQVWYSGCWKGLDILAGTGWRRPLSNSLFCPYSVLFPTSYMFTSYNTNRGKICTWISVNISTWILQIQNKSNTITSRDNTQEIHPKPKRYGKHLKKYTATFSYYPCCLISLAYLLFT